MQPDGNARINKIVQFVEGNYQRKISLEDIGEEVGMSATSVCRFFKKYTHQNLWNYLNGFRIVRAAQMIVETDDPIAEIGMRAGSTTSRISTAPSANASAPRRATTAQVRVDGHFARRETGRGDRPQAG